MGDPGARPWTRLPRPVLAVRPGRRDAELGARAYARSGSAVEFKLFTDRSHFICNQDGWESVAAFVLDWVGALTGQACAPG